VTIKPYEAINEALEGLDKIGVDSSKCNSALHKIVKDKMIAVTDIVALIKCQKNPVEA
jgi:ribosomal protein S12